MSSVLATKDHFHARHFRILDKKKKYYDRESVRRWLYMVARRRAYKFAVRKKIKNLGSLVNLDRIKMMGHRS